jgi:hypothetical protein
MIRLVMVMLIVGLSTIGCRAPGQPPHQPDHATYADLMRREIATASSALGSAQLVIAQARAGRVTVTYAQVGLRQAADDLDAVATDLAQVAPPNGRANAQRRFQTIVSNSRRLLRTTSQRWPEDRALAMSESSCGESARKLDGDVATALGV